MSLADALSSLCIDVIRLIANHLEVDDIGRMDSAICDTQCRSALLPKFILHGPAFSVKRFFTACICRNVSSESAALFEIWIAKRRLKLRERLVVFGCSVPWFALWNIVSATHDYIGGACFFALHEKLRRNILEMPSMAKVGFEISPAHFARTRSYMECRLSFWSTICCYCLRGVVTQHGRRLMILHATLHNYGSHHANILLHTIATECLRLYSLRLCGAMLPISDDAMVQVVQHCTELEDLHVQGAYLENDTIYAVADMRRRLKGLSITTKMQINDGAMLHMLLRCPCLRVLKIRSAEGGITSTTAIVAGQHCAELREIFLPGRYVWTNAAKRAVAIGCPKLKMVAWGEDVTEQADLQEIQRWRRIRKVGDICYK